MCLCFLAVSKRGKMDSCFKTLSFLLIISVLTIGKIKALSLQGFIDNLQDECFKNGESPSQWQPDSATSVENFIHMIEKIERSYQGSTEELIRALLLRFSCNRLETDKIPLKRDDTAKYFDQLMEIFLKNKVPELPELTSEEKCQLFFMLSPAKKTVTETQESGDQQKVHGYGFLSLNADSKRAIDMSKVLHGIYAGLKDNPIIRIGDVKPDAAQDVADKQVELLFASTISEVINVAVKTEKELTDDNYGDDGTWTSNLCTKEYQYNKTEFKWPVTAEIIGALDGFFLGSEIKKMEDKQNMKLSQILRMYYSQKGFVVNHPAVSYCNRKSSIDGVTELKEQSVNYLLAYSQLTGDPVQNLGEKVREFAQMLNSLKLELTEAEIDDCLEKEKGVDICATPNNVFVVLDKRSNITMQTSTTGELTSEMNIGFQEDTITIYLNVDIENLQTVVNASDSKAETFCALEKLDPYSFQTSAEDSKVLTDIKNIMTVYEENQKSLHGVPSKVVVYFNLEDRHEQDKRALEKARRELASRHHYLTMIPVGEDSEYLKQYFTNNQPSRMILWHEQDLAHKLMEKICLAPAVLQHPDCETKSKYEDSEYTGYVSSFNVQHWVMHPKYFLKTFNYKFQFTGENGNIRVCFSKDGPVTNSGDKNCHQTDEKDTSVVFKGSNPCKGRTVHNCDPLYFSIFGREGTSRCIQTSEGNSGCKRLDDIKYTIKHEGISCSSGKNLISSPFLQMLLAFLVTSYILSQQK